MMADYADDIKTLGDKIVALTVGQAVQLGDYLEKVHGIKPAAGGGVMMAAAAGPAAAAEKPAEQTEFTVVLEGFDAAKKIGIIKVVREIAGLGLAEAKAFVEGAPKNVKEGLGKPEAEALKKKLEEAGAKVAIK
jgi:large subunit ribosomal protein L7/L12